MFGFGKWKADYKGHEWCELRSLPKELKQQLKREYGYQEIGQYYYKFEGNKVYRFTSVQYQELKSHEQAEAESKAKQRRMNRTCHVCGYVTCFDPCQYCQKPADYSRSCAGCRTFTDVQDGLCNGCRTLLRQKGLELYRKSVRDVQVVNKTQDSFTVSVDFFFDVEAKIKTIQRENIGAGGITESDLMEPFYILSAVLKSKKISNNRVKIKLDRTRDKRIGRLISGGHYDFMEGVDAGYLVHVSVDLDDGCLISLVAKVLREQLKFAIHPSNLSIDGYLKDGSPDEQGQAVLLDKLAEVIPKQIKDEIARTPR